MAEEQQQENSLLRDVRKLVIFYKNWEQELLKEKEHQLYKKSYSRLRARLERGFGVERVQKQFELDYPKYSVGEDLSTGD